MVKPVLDVAKHVPVPLTGMAAGQNRVMAGGGPPSIMITKAADIAVL